MSDVSVEHDPALQVKDQAPGWARDYLEGLDFLAKERHMAELEAKLPGLTRVFKSLIQKLPEPNRKGNPEFPVAACVVGKDANGNLEVVSSSLQRVNELNDSIEHAEMLALHEAQKVTGSKHLTDHILLTTLEPCVQCCGAAYNTEVDSVIYAVDHADVEGQHALVDSQFKPWRISPEGHDARTLLPSLGLTVVSGFMREETLNVMNRTPVNWNEYYRDSNA